MNNICHICGRDIVSPVDPLCECAEDLNRYHTALVRLSCLGNGDVAGNSEGNRIAQRALKP